MGGVESKELDATQNKEAPYRKRGMCNFLLGSSDDESEANRPVPRPHYDSDAESDYESVSRVKSTLHNDEDEEEQPNKSVKSTPTDSTGNEDVNTDKHSSRDSPKNGENVVPVPLSDSKVEDAAKSNKMSDSMVSAAAQLSKKFERTHGTGTSNEGSKSTSPNTYDKSLSDEDKRNLLRRSVNGEISLSDDDIEAIIDDVGSNFLSIADQNKLQVRLEDIARCRYDDEVRKGSVSILSQSRTGDIARAMGFQVDDENPDVVITPSGSTIVGEGALSHATGMVIDDQADIPDTFDEEQCARCQLLQKPQINQNDGGACCSDCFLQGSFDFKSTIYHMNDEHHACGADYPESEIEILKSAGRADLIEHSKAEWRHVHAVWHKNHPKERDRDMCPVGDHDLCRPEYGFGCTPEEIEARTQIDNHNMDLHDLCPEDFPVYGMYTPEGEPFTPEQAELVCALWRHSHNRHELCRPYLEVDFNLFECTLEMCAEDEREWNAELLRRQKNASQEANELQGQMASSSDMAAMGF